MVLKNANLKSDSIFGSSSEKEIHKDDSLKNLRFVYVFSKKKKNVYASKVIFREILPVTVNENSFRSSSIHEANFKL